ncbi:MAG: hypothetical protein KBD83_02440 [Gammaproteobacteria bacterium]|nr:hypothetical protein [Gammaproteobacteria bacterium]
MNFQPTPLIRISFLKDQEKIFMGRLALKDRRIFFEYDQSFIKTGIELSLTKYSKEALNIIDEVRLAVEKWDVFAKEAGVTLSSQKIIKRKLK